MVYGFVQLHYITDLEEIFIFSNKKVSYLYGFWRFANAYNKNDIKGRLMEENKIFVTRATLPPKKEFLEYVDEIWESAWLTNMGDVHNELEKKLSEFMDDMEIVLTVNGHLALELALQSLKIEGEVITTPFTFASTTHAIVRNGLKPVFCDIKEDDFTIDPQKIEKLINKNTKAIMPVHVYGNICDVEAIESIAKKYELYVIYDAAHTFGERYKGKSVADFGDMSVFSFHATKVFNTIEGGAIALRDKNIRKSLDFLKNFGIADKEMVPYVGSNAKMNEFAAAMGLCNMRHLPEYIEKRRNISEIYTERLSDLKGIRLNKYNNDTVYNYAYFPIVVENGDRDELYESLARENIFARKYFYPCTNAYECYSKSFDANDTPIALDISKKVLTLPIYPDLEATDVERICDIIRR